jgi:hypothetical protein
MALSSQGMSMVARFVVATLFVPWLPVSPALAQAAAPGLYDFAYRVSGDRRVAPVQVFDDGQSTFVQFKAGQTVPAIFRVAEGGEQLAPSTARGGYVVLAGTASEWIMRIGSVVSAAHYEGDAREGRGSMAGRGNAFDVTDDVTWAAPDGRAAGARGAALASSADARGVASMSSGDVRGGRNGLVDARGTRGVPAAGQVAMTRTAALAPQPAPAPMRPSVAFDASSSDPTMRAVLTRWAKLAGWSFDAQHWTVDVDIPLAGTASFGADFKSAVRDLLASTELSTRPLQPCFYSNQVLRVVPLAEACNRAATVASTR